MKFEIKDFKQGGYKLFEKLSRYANLIGLGDIYLSKENCKKLSFCFQREDTFDYHGIEKALSLDCTNCGKTNTYVFTNNIVSVEFSTKFLRKF